MRTTRALVLSLLLLACSQAWAATYFPMFASWPQPGGPGSPLTLTYSFSNLFDGSLRTFNGTPLDPSVLHSAFETALQDYANFLPIHFVEMIDRGPLPETGDYDPSGLANIRIGQVPHVDNANAYAYFPLDSENGLAGDIVFNAARFGSGWTAAFFYAVAQHELGHSLGMGHAETIPDTPSSVLQQALYTGPLFVIDAGAISALQAVYGAGTGSVNPVPLPPAVWLLGGALATLGHRRRMRQA